MDYNINGNIFLNATIKIEEFGSQNGCTVLINISGDKGSDESATMELSDGSAPIDRTDESIYIWTLGQLKKFEI